MVERYRKKPVVIDAWRYPIEPSVHDNAFLHRWVNDNGGETEVVNAAPMPYIAICTLEGPMRVTPGDWIIRGVRGEFYPCKSDIFAATYEPAAAGETEG